MRAVGVLLLIGGLLVGCSSQKSDPIQYDVAHRRLPAEEPYGTTAYMQPPVVIPSRSVSHEAPLLAAPSQRSPSVSPTLPPARRKGQKY